MTMHAISPRHAFQPPRYRIEALGPDGVAAVAPLPLLTDIFGEDVDDGGATVRLAHADGFLHVHVHVRTEDPTIRADLGSNDADFWRQDHLEVRLQRDPQHPDDQIQIILAASGIVAVHPTRLAPSAVTVEVVRTSRDWTLTARIETAALAVVPDIDAPTTRPLLRGQVAYMRWRDGQPTIAGCTPTVLGFAQQERFAEFLLSPRTELTLLRVEMSPGPLQVGINQAVAVLANRGAAVCRGRLIVWRELLGHAGATACHPVEVPPGGTTAVAIEFACERPLLARFHLRWDTLAHSHDLASLTLRAGISPAVLPAGLVHPYLAFTPDAVAQVRTQLAAETDTGATPYPRHLPEPPPATITLAWIDTAEKHDWHRFAAELIATADAHGGPSPYRRCWDLINEDERALVRQCSRQPTVDQTQRTALIKLANGLLARQDFFQDTAWQAAHLSPRCRALLMVADLTPDQMVLRNRLLLQACNPLVFRSGGLDAVRQATACALAWVRSGDVEAVQRATAWVRHADTQMLLGAQIDLHEGNIAPGFALAYDALHPLLNPSEWPLWCRVLATFVDLHLASASARTWTTTCVPNANAVCNGGAGVAALALLGEHPAAITSLRLARKLITVFADFCHGADGGNTEGAQYWQYGLDSALVFAWNLERALGSDDGLLGHPMLRQAGRMIATCLSNDGAMHGVNDTIPMPVGGDIAALCARRHDDALALWYATHARQWLERRAAQGRPLAYSVDGSLGSLFRSHNTNEVARPVALPTAIHLEDTAMVMLRSEPRWDCTWSVSLKGSRPPYTHHNQPDTGAVSIELAGERLLIDPGYYKAKPEHHCLAVIDGVAPHQPSGWTGRILACDHQGDLAWSVCDATAAYRGAVQRLRRHVVVVGDAAVIALDEIAPAPGRAGSVAWHWQCGGATSLTAPQTILVQGQQRSLRLDLDAPHASIDLGSERDLHDTHWGYHFADCRWFPVMCTTRADPALPLIAVATDVTGSTATDGPRVVRQGRALAVHLTNGRVCAFLRGVDGWQLIVPD